MKITTFKTDTDLIKAKNLIFNTPEKGAEKQESGAARPANDNADAPKTLSEVEAAMKTVEDQYGEKKNGKLVLDEKRRVVLASNTPANVQKQYKKLQDVQYRLFTALQESHTASQEAKTAVKSQLEGSEHDPLAGFRPAELVADKPQKAPVAPQKAASEKSSDTANATSTDTKNDKLEESMAVLDSILNDLDNGSTTTILSPEQAALIRKFIKPGKFGEITRTTGKYTLDRSNDGNFLRVYHGGMLKIYALDARNEAKIASAKFKNKTPDEVDQGNIEKNTQELQKQLAWLESDAADVGASVIIKSEKVQRAGANGEVKDVIVSTLVRKGPMGLRIATFEMDVIKSPDTDKSTFSKVREVSSVKYDLQSALALVSLRTGTVTPVESNPDERRAELKKSMDRIGYDLVALLPFGTESPQYQNALANAYSIAKKFNIGKWSYHSDVMDYIAKLEDGKISIYDATKKNPDYKDEKTTPSIPQYALVKGPLELKKAA